jgi:hypothetical protein
MTFKSDILARFNNGSGTRPFYLPDLTLWYDWHAKKETLPKPWQNASLTQISHDLGVPIWLTVRPWRVEIPPEINISTTEHDKERIVRVETPAGVLESRWTIGPDGAWWQTEYPVKNSSDLPAVLDLVTARTYALDPGKLIQPNADVGSNGIVAIEIPRRPYSDLLHEFLGWSDGLMLLGEPIITEIIEVLEKKLRQFVEEVKELPGQIVFAPDNLDGQFIPPVVFEEYLATSYQCTTESLHQANKYLVVHIGGPIKHLLTLLAQTGIDGLEGIAGLPQNNATLTDARELTGPAMILWGGIPQDYLLDTHDHSEFGIAVQQAILEIADDPRMLLGVADRVPVEADIDRLRLIPQMIDSTFS